MEEVEDGNAVTGVTWNVAGSVQPLQLKYHPSMETRPFGSTK